MTEETALKLIEAVNRLADALERPSTIIHTHQNIPEPHFGGGGGYYSHNARHWDAGGQRERYSSGKI